jgi:hypothetical protein
MDWEGYSIDVRRVGAPLSAADEAIDAADWLGLSSHFTFESGVVRDLIAYARRRKPGVKIMVGGADVAVRPDDYLAFGADLAFVGDFEPGAFRAARGRRRLLSPRVVGAHRHPFAELTAPAFHKLPRLAEYSDSHDGPVPAGVSFPIGFVYFTRGCPRECDFCETRRTSFEALDLEAALGMIENYHRAGIRTLNFADDNLLLLAARAEGRRALLAILAEMRRLGFAWEFPNGLEIGRLVQGGGVDEELIAALLSHARDPSTGRLVGAYRVYIPVETFERRTDYKKLRPVREQNQVIAAILAEGIPEIDFGVVIDAGADADTFTRTRDGYHDLRELVAAGGRTRARYEAFHLIPIALHRGMRTKYSIHDFPEGWNFHFPVYDGVHFSARELFERRLRLAKEIDLSNYRAMMEGQYGYS